MVTHLAGAEIRYLLDIYKGKNDDSELIPLLYSLLGDIVNFLVSNEEEALGLGDKSLTSIRKALFETFLAVGSFLSDRWVNHGTYHSVFFVKKMKGKFLRI